MPFLQISLLEQGKSQRRSEARRSQGQYKGEEMTSYLFFGCVKHITKTSDMPDGSQKDNVATSFVGQIKQRSLEIAYSIQNCGGFE